MTEEHRKLVAAHRGIALAVLKRMSIRADEDALAEAQLALCECVVGWNTNRNHSLTTHLWNGVYWHMCAWLTRRSSAAHVCLSPSGEVENHGEASTDPAEQLELKTSALALCASLRGRGIDPEAFAGLLKRGETVVSAASSFSGFDGTGPKPRRARARLRRMLRGAT